MTCVQVITAMSIISGKYGCDSRQLVAIQLLIDVSVPPRAHIHPETPCNSP